MQEDIWEEDSVGDKQYGGEDLQGGKQEIGAGESDIWEELISQEGRRGI